MSLYMRLYSKSFPLKRLLTKFNPQRSALSQWSPRSHTPGKALSGSLPSTHTGQPKAQKPAKQIANYCSSCGGKVELAIPEGDNEWRHVCTKCGGITYYNPKMVVGVICEHEGKILMCKRAIEPCKGMWTIPAGYMEMGESSAEGAARETLEEAGAHVQIIAPYAHFDIPRIGQAYVLFRAKLLPPYTCGPSSESLESAFVSPEDIPFDQIAFSSVSLALKYYAEEMKTGQYQVHHAVIEKAEGSSPNQLNSYFLRDEMSKVLAL